MANVWNDLIIFVKRIAKRVWKSHKKPTQAFWHSGRGCSWCWHCRNRRLRNGGFLLQPLDQLLSLILGQTIRSTNLNFNKGNYFDILSAAMRLDQLILLVQKILKQCNLPISPFQFRTSNKNIPWPTAQSYILIAKWFYKSQALYFTGSPRLPPSPGGATEVGELTLDGVGGRGSALWVSAGWAGWVGERRLGTAALGRGVSSSQSSSPSDSTSFQHAVKKCHHDHP